MPYRLKPPNIKGISIMDIIAKKIECLKRAYPIIETNMRDILVNMVKTAPKQIVHFAHTVTVPADSETVNILKDKGGKSKYIPMSIVSMSLDEDEDIVFHTLTDEDIYEYDVFGGIIAIFTMLDAFKQINV